MKKVINITLGGVVFAIEQDAHEKLAAYLEQIKANLTDIDDVKEVVDDIEGAIAEKFGARKLSEKFAVTIADVDVIITELGSPTEFNLSESGDNPDESKAADSAQTNTETKKRLYRDMDNALLGGVASGLAQYFDIDPVVTRLLIVIAVFFNGLGVFVYLLLWLIVPAAKTTSDKYAMRGEVVTLKEISDRVKKNIKNLDQSEYGIDGGSWTNLRSILNKLFQLLSSFIKLLGHAVRYVFGATLIIAGALGAAGTISLYSILLLSDRALFPPEAQLALDLQQGTALGILSMFSVFMSVSILATTLIVAGAGIVVRRNFFTMQKTVALVVAWIVVTVVATSITALHIQQIRHAYNPDEVVSDTPAHIINI